MIPLQCLKILNHTNQEIHSDPNRYAIRAIVFKNDKLLMSYLTKTGEYKFPGGGMEKGESHEDTLSRETLEETGANIVAIKSCIGFVDQIYPDIYDNKKVFYMRSYYYLCEVDEKVSKQVLSDSEKELDFVPEWVPIKKAIETNQRCMEKGPKYHWTERELFVLEYLNNNR